MKSNMILLIFLVLIFQVQLILEPEKRQELLDRLAKEISLSDLHHLNDDDSLTSFKAMKYNVSDIQALLTKYDLPENFNYFNATGAKKNVKNQKSCGSCWSFAATSSLAYRYLKYGLDLDLSPQDGLSCYIRDCDWGNFQIDPELNLVKNGTVTEGCLPYKSGDGKTIPECPTTCKDGTEYKRYYAQNAYLAQNNRQADFYDLVIMIMDQLVTQGPVSGGFTVYADFDDFGEDPDKCLNDVYTFNGTAENTGGHAISITGYGLLNNKFYWLIQNSWGADWCDNGFIKVEIGEIEEFSFSVPYIKNEEKEPVDIEVTFKKKYASCKFDVESPSMENWNNTLDITFTNKQTSQNIFYQVNKNQLYNREEISCNFEYNRVFYGINKGTYTYETAKSLGIENNFKLNSFEGQSFEYYGYDELYYIIQKNYYVSQARSKIVFEHYYDSVDDSMPPIFMDYDAKVPLKNCYHLRTSTDIKIDLGYCEITQEDLDYIEKNEVELTYLYLCGYLDYSNIFLLKLDEANPVFEVKKFIKPKDEAITVNTDLILVSNTKANIPVNEALYFYAIMEIENNIKNTSALVYCSTQINSENSEAYSTCNINSGTYQYQNIYLLPYTIKRYGSTPFDIIINSAIKAEDEPEPSPEEEEQEQEKEKEQEKEQEKEKEKEDEKEDEKESEEEPDESTDPDTGVSYYLEYPLSLFFSLLLLF